MNTPIFIVSWILWVMCLASEAMVTYFRLMPKSWATAETIENSIATAWLFRTVMIGFFVVAFGCWLLQRVLVCRATRAARFWVWPVTFLLYGAILIAIAVGNTPSVANPNDTVTWWGIGLGAAFLILALPAWQPERPEA